MISKIALKGNAAAGSEASAFPKFLGLTEAILKPSKVPSPAPQLAFTKKADEYHCLMESMHRKAANNDVDGAIAEAKAGIRMAIERGEKDLVVKIALEAMNIAMYDALFSKKDLDFAIEIAKQARAYAIGTVKEAPGWIPLNFYMFAHRPLAPLSSPQVRRRVLAGMPDFSTNHLAQMKELRAAIEHTLVSTRAGHMYVQPEEAAELAKLLKELSFLSPKNIYDENIAFIRSTFEEFGKSEIAAYNNYTPEKVRQILEKRIPGIFAKKKPSSSPVI